MKPLGYRSLWKEMDSKDGSVDKHIKRYKRSERQQAKKDIQKSLFEDLSIQPTEEEFRDWLLNGTPLPERKLKDFK